MTICPIAIAVGCKKCPAFSICPLKGVLGDQPGGGAQAPGATRPGGDGKPQASPGAKK